ncbi:MAG: hypothetical protein ACLFM4_06105 [Phormidium sp.]
MQFDEVWQQYDFTEAELLGMGWQLPYNYVLHLNYYWDLNNPETTADVASVDQPIKLILNGCIHLDIQMQLTLNSETQPPAHLGTIVGWGQVTPSPWLAQRSLAASEWMHLFFDIGGNHKIEAIARSLSIESLTDFPLATAVNHDYP